MTFTGSGGTLTLSSASLDSSKFFDAPIAGFNSSDTIDYAGTVTTAIDTNGVLTLWNGSTVVANLNLSGNYASDRFIVAPAGPNTQIVVAGSGDTATAPAGTSSSANYVLSGPVASSWDVASNWTETSPASGPASVAPGCERQCHHQCPG